jgi:glycosyltransferase involved in cell wall biosynthesis
MKGRKRIAIFHDYIDAIGGAEKLVLTLARGIGADVITTDVNRESVREMGFEDVKIISIGRTIKFPILKHMSASMLFTLCDFSKEYDFFIMSGNWSIYAASKHKPNIWYCHSPMRAFYDLRDFVIRSQKDPIRGFIGWNWTYFYRILDQQAVKSIDKIVVNSKNVQERVKKYYGRNSVVVYPPVPTNDFHYRKNGDFWLSVNRLYPHKRIDLQIDTFRNLPGERLKIIGGVSEGDPTEDVKALLSKLPKNIEVVGAVSENELRDYYANCKAFITTAIAEDFGLTVVEAMAAGKPVVAVNEGGYRETVMDGKTGRLVKSDSRELIEAVKEISKAPSRYRKSCEKQAKKFDTKVFIERMKKKITGVLA